MGGAIIGSGTVSNRDADGGPGKPVAEGGVGYSCLAEIRTVETILHGAPKTPYLNFGDRVRIEMNDAQGPLDLRRDRPGGGARVSVGRAHAGAALHATCASADACPVPAVQRAAAATRSEPCHGGIGMSRYYIPALGNIYAKLDRYMLPLLRDRARR